MLSRADEDRKAGVLDQDVFTRWLVAFLWPGLYNRSVSGSSRPP